MYFGFFVFVSIYRYYGWHTGGVWNSAMDLRFGEGWDLLWLIHLLCSTCRRIYTLMNGHLMSNIWLTLPWYSVIICRNMLTASLKTFCFHIITAQPDQLLFQWISIQHFCSIFLEFPNAQLNALIFIIDIKEKKNNNNNN